MHPNFDPKSRSLALKTCLVALPLALATLACSTKTQAPAAAANDNVLPQEIAFRVSGTYAEAGIQFRLGRQLEVGPAENGQIHRELLSEQELARLEGAWNAFKGSALGKTETCVEWPAESEWHDPAMRIALLQNDREVLSIRSDAGRLCGPGGGQQLLAFAETVLTLTRAYYPKSFPDQCLAEQDEFKSITENVVGCADDSQCVNVDPQFDAIPAGQIQFVTLRSCTVVPALPSANRDALEVAKTRLLRLRDRVLAACAATPQPAASCSAAESVGFQNDRHPARCIAGQCTSGLSFN